MPAVDAGSGRSKLKGMKQFRRLSTVVALWLVVAAVACRRDRPIAAGDSTHAPSLVPSDTSASRAPSTWDPGAGAALLVAADSPTRALVILPTEGDTSALASIPHPASVMLFGRGGDVQTADLSSTRD